MKRHLYDNSRVLIGFLNSPDKRGLMFYLSGVSIDYLILNSGGSSDELIKILSDKDHRNLMGTSILNVINQVKRGLLNVKSVFKRLKDVRLDFSKRHSLQELEIKIQKTKEKLRKENNRGKYHMEIFNLALSIFSEFETHADYEKERSRVLKTKDQKRILAIHLVDYLIIKLNHFFMKVENKTANIKKFKSSQIITLCTFHCGLKKIKEDFVYGVKNQCLFWQMYNNIFIDKFKEYLTFFSKRYSPIFTKLRTFSNPPTRRDTASTKARRTATKR